jgi:aspartate-semialdehyde dehydrogenase
MPGGPPSLHKVAIVGASSLLGKDLKQVLEDRNFPASEIILLDESMAGTLTEAGGEPTFVRALEEESFEGAQFVFFAGSAADAARNCAAAQRAGATVIDLTGGTIVQTGAVPRISALGAAFPASAPHAGNGSAPARVYSAPTAPVLIAATLAAALQKFQMQRIVLFLLAPASERDQAGIEELESQTAALLSFREISKNVFDAQVAFNVLSAYGEESKPRLEDLRAEVARETARFLAGRTPAPAIQLLQAPVFYGYAFSAYVEFASAIDAAPLQAALASVGVKVAAAHDPAPSNVSAAGESEIQMAPIAADANFANGVWMTGAADNLRVATANAVRIAEELLAE